jgi:hypothetical protein
MSSEQIIDFIDDDWGDQNISRAVFGGKKSCYKRNLAIALFVYKKDNSFLKELPKEILYKPYVVEETESYFDWKTMRFENVVVKYTMMSVYDTICAIYASTLYDITEEEIYSVFDPIKKCGDTSVAPSYEIGLLNHFDKTSIQLC